MSSLMAILITAFILLIVGIVAFLLEEAVVKSRLRNIDKLKKKHDINGLKKLVQSRSPRIRVKAVKTLGSMKDQRSVECLVSVLNSCNECWSEDMGNQPGYVMIAKAIGRLDPTQRHNAIRLSLKNWYRAEARTWWKESDREKGICDDCGQKGIVKGAGFLRPGGYLACERCLDEGLHGVPWDEALQNFESWFGHEVPKSIKKLRDSWR